MKAVKGNKEYSISENQQKFYQDNGYDIKDSNGSTVAYGKGKTVPYGEYMALIEENELLHKKIAEMQEALEKTGKAEEAVKAEEKKANSKKAGE